MPIDRRGAISENATEGTRRPTPAVAVMAFLGSIVVVAAASRGLGTAGAVGLVTAGALIACFAAFLAVSRLDARAARDMDRTADLVPTGRRRP